MKDIVGFYRTCETAEQVKDALVDAGYDRGDVTIYDKGDRDEAGLWESIKRSFGYMDEQDQQITAEAARRGLVAVALNYDEDDSPERAVAVMRKYGPLDMDGEAAQWRTAGWTATGATARQPTARQATTTAATTSGAVAGQAAQRAQAGQRPEALEGKAVLPVVEEQLHVGKREAVTGGVRIYQRVTSRPVEEKVQLREEHVHVERRPVDRPATAADGAAFRERAVEVTERQEKPVVAKEARVVEEVVVNKDVQQRTETVRDTVRRADVDVQQVNPGQAAAFAPDTFADEIVRDERFRGRDWSAVEPDVRRSFEQRYPGGRWEQFKDAVHRGYERARQKV